MKNKQLCKPHLFILFGPSGTGKSTILRYLEQSFGGESAPKYTNRPNRFTIDDNCDFIFCERSEFPSSLLIFESYGHFFGIQLNEIANSVKKGKSHITIVGHCDVVKELIAIYGNFAVPIFIYCESSVLKYRIFNYSSHLRINRWPQISEEISNIYDQLSYASFVINNSGSKEDTYHQIDRLLTLLG